MRPTIHRDALKRMDPLDSANSDRHRKPASHQVTGQTRSTFWDSIWANSTGVSGIAQQRGLLHRNLIEDQPGAYGISERLLKRRRDYGGQPKILARPSQRAFL